MPIAKITGQGLIAIAFLVALLWSSIAAERVIERQAYTERARILREYRMMHRRRMQMPVSIPVPGMGPRAIVTTG